MSTRQIEQAERLTEEAAAGGQVIAYQLGTVYPCFDGAARSELSNVFSRHGFEKAADRILDIDAERALAAASRGVGKRRDGLRVDALEADTEHGRAVGVYRVDRAPGERASRFTLGARVFTFDGRVHAAPPVDAAEIPEALSLGRDLAERANWLLEHADTQALSHVLTECVRREAGALPFIGRGIYVARVGHASTERLVELFRELRDRFYNEASRTGVRASALVVTAQDKTALSDAVIDEMERRLEEIEESLRDEANRAVKPDTLERRRDTCEQILSDLSPVRDLIGRWNERLAERALRLRNAYQRAVDGIALELPGDEAAEAPPVAAPPAPPAAEPFQPAPVRELRAADSSQPKPENDAEAPAAVEDVFTL